jgi:hypothetical protein
MARKRNCGHNWNSVNPCLEDIACFDHEMDPILAQRVKWLLDASSEQYAMMIKCRRKNDHYYDREKRLPAVEGYPYIELLVYCAKDPRRIIINEVSQDIFVSPDHYRTLYYAGTRCKSGNAG